MEFDPYDNLPSKADLKKSGATDWLNDAFAEQKRRNASLKAALGGEKASLDAQRKDLESLLELPPGESAEEDVPDIFAQERSAVEKKRAALSGLVGDMEESRLAEKEMLKNLFGK